MLLFPEKPSGDASPARHNESHYEFLARVDTEAWARVRAELTKWVDALPTEVRGDVVGRLQSDDAHHRGAWWEVYLHAALLHSGYKMSAHPEIPGSTRRPDYQAIAADGSFFIEAHITGRVPTGIAGRRRVNAVLDLLNAINSPSFFLDVDFESTGDDPPGTRQLRGELEAWLGTLDPDAISSPEQWPEWRWSNSKGWTMLFRAIPKHDARGQSGQRPVGMYDHGDARILDHRGTLLDALQLKGSRYGDLKLPYVVAVMDDGEHPPDASFIADALYGRAASDFDPTTRTLIERAERDADGYWRDRNGPRHSGVSAVITAWSLSPWDVARKLPRVWHNPYANYPLVSRLPFPSVRYRRESNDFEEVEAQAPAHELFGLPADWPNLPVPNWAQRDDEDT